ncbi:MAG: ATP-dependent DNA helicase RecG [Thermodesulfobacteriota bacterium]|nr:ATP-dependent DNA helicase RecG [Thermodesulfobacteriota bacterium]
MAGPKEKKKGLSTPIQFTKGVGPKLADALKKKGIETVRDALYYIPRKYEDRRDIKTISKLEAGRMETFTGKIIDMKISPYRKNRKRILEMVLGDESGTITAKWFVSHYGYFKGRFKKGQELILSGEIKNYRCQREIHHPDVETFEDTRDSLNFNRIVPIYSETEGLRQKTIRRIIKGIVDQYSDLLTSHIPLYIRKRLKLLELSEAIKKIHFPEMDTDFTGLISGRYPAYRTIIFDELFFLELGLAVLKRRNTQEKGVAFKVTNSIKKRLISSPPFHLTKAQERVIAEIEQDMKRPFPMHRLIQGDVGSGKTIVAIIAALITVENGYQACIMAPTEILAKQHFLSIFHLTKRFKMKTALLTSNIKKAQKEETLKAVRDGTIDIVIGTHAVIQENVDFNRLGLGVIDEQHRFGVIQRAALMRKGYNPDILVMTATPIPRTLAMTLYGDLDISIIDELPPGRRPVVTKLYHEKDRKKVYKIIQEEVERGRQVYIVCPLVEESEKLDLKDATQMAEHIKRDIFPDFRVGLIHGRMQFHEKEEVMSLFKYGEIDILVSTTVIEVGIDVPNATVMVVEHAEKFGLSQLHQLRGRIGRGEDMSLCLLLAKYSQSDGAQRRLNIMESTTDGFKISEEDLAIRGPGDFIGFRQSGFPDLRVTNIVRDKEVLIEARKEAFAIIENDPHLTDTSNRHLKKVLQERWKGRLELATVG